MLRKIRQVAELTGVTVRTLQYYDRIGLLPPTAVTEAGYRLYGDEALETLQEILFFRELDFPLQEIAAIMAAPGYDRRAALARHRTLLLAKRSRMDGLIALVESTLQGENTMEFKPFDTSGLEAARAQYAAEARQRWGGTEAYAESARRTGAYSSAQWAALQAEADAIFDALAARTDRDPGDPEVQALVDRWQAHISAHYYPCTDEILAGLGRMYTDDPRFSEYLDRRGPGTAALLSAAIARRAEK